MDTRELTWTEEVYRIHERDFAYKPTVDKGPNSYTPAWILIIEQAVQRAIEYGESFNLELEVITAKGNLRWVHNIGKVDPEKRKVVGFFQDITERKCAEEALQISEQKHRQLFETMSQGVIYYDAGGKILSANLPPSKSWGFLSDSMTGQTYQAPKWKVLR